MRHKLCYCGFTPGGLFIQCDLHKELEKWREKEDEINEMSQLADEVNR